MRGSSEEPAVALDLVKLAQHFRRVADEVDAVIATFDEAERPDEVRRLRRTSADLRLTVGLLLELERSAKKTGTIA